MRTFLLFILSLVIGMANAQEEQVLQKNKKPLFFSINQLGLLEGNTGSAFAVQSVNGVQWKGWGLGAGTGFDWYRIRTVPVFLHVHRQVPWVKRPLFLYIDGGTNIPWPRKAQNDHFTDFEYNNGRYVEAGIQYLLKVSRDNALVFSAGYSEKKYHEKFSAHSWSIWGPLPVSTNLTEYRFRRIALKAGFQF